MGHGLSPSRSEDHRIELEPGAQPTVQRQFQLSQSEQEELQQQLDYLLTKGFIRPSTMEDSECVSTTARSTGSPSSRVTRSREPTNFSTNFAVPSFSRKSTCEEVTIRFASPLKIVTRRHFKSAMATTSTWELLDKCVIIYLDDILVYSHSREQHLQDLGAVFALPHKNCLITKGSKCDFLKHELEFLGHIVSTEGVKIDPKKIKTIQEWKSPSNIKELRHTTATGHYFNKRDTSRIWVPGYDLLRTLLIQESHDNPTSEHFGVDKTIKALQRNYYWSNMANNVRKYVSSCTAYQIMKSSHQRAAGILQPLDPPERPWKHITMDCVTGLPAGPSGNDAILVVVDRLTKMVHFIAGQQKLQPSKLPNSSSPTSSDCTDCRPQLFQTQIRNSHRIFGATCGNNSAPNYSFPQPTTHRPTGRPNESTKLWSNSFVLHALTHRQGRNPFRRWNSRIITRLPPQPINPIFPQLQTGPRGSADM
ncbi:hypothetical protein CLOP_g17993 [Closterium sp. NIES-67]|nr:hypothetical protein CLOP_g17993 [Closterium sp. NIES-67]